MEKEKGRSKKYAHMIGLIIFLWWVIAPMCMAAQIESINEKEILGKWYKSKTITPILSFYYGEEGERFGYYYSQLYTWRIEGNSVVLDYEYGATEIMENVRIENGCMNYEIVSDGTCYEVELYSTPEYVVCSSGDYSDGLAWIQCGDLRNQYWACIDKMGKGIFRFHSDANAIDSVKSFSKGYAYIQGEDYVAVIDEQGNVISKYPIDTTHFVLAYADGYVLTEEFVSDFSSSKYVIRLCDAEGNILAQSTRNAEGIENEYDIDNSVGRASYCGNGIFAINRIGEIFSVNGEIWKYEVEGEAEITEMSIQGSQGVLDFEIDYDKGGAWLTIVDVEGNIQKYSIAEEELSPFAKPVLRENICVFRYNYNAGLGLYNVKAQKFIKLDKYVDQIYWDMLPNTLVFQEGCIVLPFLGKDGNLYVAMFDTEWNVVMEPVRAEHYDYSNGLLLINDGEMTSLYDNKGSVLFSLTEGDQTYSGFTDGISRLVSYKEGNYIYEVNDPTYINIEGERLFDTIDMTECVECMIADVENVVYSEMADSEKKMLTSEESVSGDQITDESVDEIYIENELLVGVSDLYVDGLAVWDEDYIMPQSASQYLSEDELENLTLKGLCYAKNEIYARYGREFMSKELTDYFNKQSWYIPKYEASQETDVMIVGMMNEFERYNKDLISAVEQRKGPYVLDK